MPPAPPATSPAPPAPPHKSVSFCAHCDGGTRASSRDARYYSDPGRAAPPPPQPAHSASLDSDLKYYSEPDAKNYFEIDYEFLKELRKIARNNCPACERKRSRRAERDKPARSKRLQRPCRQESYVFCHGRYHGDAEHCRLCCRVCARSDDTLLSTEDEQYSLAARSYSQPARSKPAASGARRRKTSVHSIKSVSFLESSNDDSKDETNYTAKSFTNDLKKFLLKPSTPRRSLRDKFVDTIKQEFEAKKKSPKLKAIKGLWKSY